MTVSLVCLAFALLAVSESKHFYSCSYAVDQGINFIDTAEAYPVPPKAEIQASPLASLSTAGAIFHAVHEALLRSPLYAGQH